MENFTKDDVAPHVVDEVPAAQIKVTFGGVELTPGQTLTTTAPDAPSREDRSKGEIINWHVISVPGCDISQGHTMTEYLGAAPSQGSGVHRYVFLFYKQTDKVTDPKFLSMRIPITDWKHRSGKKVRNFAAQMKWGQPIAGNFYSAEWDTTVPEIYKEMGLSFYKVNTFILLAMLSLFGYGK